MVYSSVIAGCVLFSLGFVHAYYEILDIPELFLPSVFGGSRQSQTTPYSCTLSPSSGRRSPAFKRYYKRYFFNSTSGTCHAFAFNDNGGNANNFVSEEECMGTCFCISPDCYLPKDPGTCAQNISSYYFDRRSGSCEQFSYNGCEGNANKFGTLAECNHKCTCGACTLTVPRGGCTGYYYNRYTRSCRRTRSVNCAAQPAMFKTMAKCNNSCKRAVCKLPLDHGFLCREYHTSYKFYFDTTTSKCTRFVHDGCGGNENMFYTEELCQSACGLERETSNLPNPRNKRMPYR